MITRFAGETIKIQVSSYDLIHSRRIGSGILRALRHYPHIEFNDEVELDHFKAIIKRPGQ